MEFLRIHEDIPVYYLTFSIIDWLPIFIGEEPCLIMAESLNFCHREKGLRVNALVIHADAFARNRHGRRIRHEAAAADRH